MRRGEIWWADLPKPVGSEPGYTRPVLIIQTNWLNNTSIDTTVVATFTTNLRLANMPGNVFVDHALSPLPWDSVVNASQLTTVDKSELTERVGELPDALMADVENGIRLVLGL